ncbi:MAG TPA: substrate-binding domain-containing protein [Clostridia bacterium]|nr:substrate-binding domain-containing protein [Clostridia bacterium]
MKTAARLPSLVLLITILFCMNGCQKNINIEGTTKNIALIVRMNNGYYWGSVKLGADAAANEFSVNVRCTAPEDEEDVEGQIRLVNSELDQKVDALILAASDYNALVEVTERASDMHIPVIIIDSEVNTDKINSYIATDNYSAGIKAGNQLIKILGGSGREAKVGIMNFVKGTRNAEQREEGLLKAISGHSGIKVVAKEYCSSDKKLAFELTQKMIRENSDISAIVALNAISSEGVAEAVSQMDLAGKVNIIAFDSTPNEIDYMEKGVIQVLITQNPFNMGYLSVKSAVEAINGTSISKYYDTGSEIINKDNMYLPENQRLLFPFIK